MQPTLTLQSHEREQLSTQKTIREQEHVLIPTSCAFDGTDCESSFTQLLKGFHAWLPRPLGVFVGLRG